MYALSNSFSNRSRQNQLHYAQLYRIGGSGINNGYNASAKFFNESRSPVWGGGQYYILAQKHKGGKNSKLNTYIISH